MKVYIVFIGDEVKVFDNEDRALNFYSALLAIDNRDIRIEEHDVIEGSIEGRWNSED